MFDTSTWSKTFRRILWDYLARAGALACANNICFHTERRCRLLIPKRLTLSRASSWASSSRGLEAGAAYGGSMGAAGLCSEPRLRPMHYGMWKCMGAGMLFTENNWLGSPGWKAGALRGRGRSRELTLIIDFQTFLTFGTKTKMAADHRSPDLKLPINKN